MTGPQLAGSLFDPLAEQVVIGSLLLNPDEQVITKLQAANFSDPHLGVLYSVIASRWRKGQSLDEVPLLNDVRQRLGAELSNGATSGEQYLKALIARGKWDYADEVDIVIGYAARRKIVAASEVAAAMARSVSVPLADVLAQLDKTTDAIRSSDVSGGDISSLASSHDELLDFLKREVETPLQLRQPPVITGWQHIDIVLDGGLVNYDKFNLAAEPGTHKSAAAQQICEVNARLGRGSLICATEMRGRQLAARHISSQTGIPTRRLMSGWVQPDDLPAITGVEKSSELVLVTASKEIEQIIGDFWRAKHQLERQGHQLRLFVLDYLQKVYANKKTGSRREEINYILTRLADLSDQTGVPQIIVSAIGRSVAPGQEPYMRQVLESSMIESEASVFMLLWRNTEHDTINWKFDKMRDGSQGPRGEFQTNGAWLV